MVRMVAFLPSLVGMPANCALLKSPYTFSKCTSVMNATLGLAGVTTGGGAGGAAGSSLWWLLPQPANSAADANATDTSAPADTGRKGNFSIMHSLQKTWHTGQACRPVNL